MSSSAPANSFAVFPVLPPRLARVVDLLAARADEHDREGAFPYQGVEALHESGLLMLTVPVEQGGSGAGQAETVRLLTALGSGDPVVALLAADTLLTHATQARGSRWPAAAYRALLAEAKRGPALVGSLRAEPGAEPVDAQRSAEGWLLTGREHAVPGGEALVWMTVEARAEDGPAVFLVSGDSAGLALEPAWERLGLRAGAVQDVHFDKTPVPATHRLTPDTPWDAAARALAIAAVCLGVARAARGWLLRAVKRLPPAEAGRLALELAEAEQLLTSLAATLDTERAGAEERALWLAPGVAQRAVASVQRALALSGPTGLTRGAPIERHLRDAVSLRALLPREDTVLEHLGQAGG